MKLPTRAAVLCTGLFGLVSSTSGVEADAKADTEFSVASARLVDEVALPAYRGLARQAAALARTTAALCEAPSAAALATARAQFGTTMSAWQHAQPLSFGPVNWQSRASRIQFWPDKRGTARRQLRKALATQEPALLLPSALDRRSVALQSLAAYETVLYEQPVDRVGGAHACGLAAAIARFQASLTAQLLQDWAGDDAYASQIRTAGPGNPSYGSARDVVADFYRSMVSALDVVARHKLERGLGPSAGAEGAGADPRPKRLESWRSGQSMQNIAANLTTVAAVYERLAPLVAARAPALDGTVRNMIAGVRAEAHAYPTSLREALGTPAGTARTVALLASVRALRAQFAGPVSQAVGLGVGFNATDGD